MMRFGKKLLAFVLVFTMVLSLVPVDVRAAEAGETETYEVWGSEEDSGNISVPYGEKVTLNAMVGDLESTTYAWYKVVAGEDMKLEEDGHSFYTVESVTGAVQYVCIITDGDGAEHRIEFYLYADTGLKAYAAGSEDSSMDVNVPVNGSATLQVDASISEDIEDQTITYRWYQYIYDEDIDESESELLPDATQSSITIEDINNFSEYCCEVSDAYGNTENVWFYVYVKSGLYAYADEDEESSSKNVPVDCGGTETLTVYAGVNEGEVSYQWYKGGAKLEGKTSATCETDAVTTSVTYRCEVSDDYGDSRSVYFYVSVNSGFKAGVKGSNYEDIEAYVDVPAGETTTLEVEASVTDGSIITYAWYDEDPNCYEEGDEGYPQELNNESTYTTGPVNERKTYYCKVSDAYDGSITIYFYVSVDSGLKAYVKDDSYQDTEAYVLVTQGETVTLEVTATANEGEPIYYTWYKSSDTGEDVVLASTIASCETEKITRNQTYYCAVSDAYGETKNVWFYVSVDSKLTVDAVGDERVEVPLNETTTLEVEATVAEGVTVTYQWYYWDSSTDEYELIEGATGTSYKTKAITTSEEYRCEVRDVYGNEESVAFTISVANNFKVEPVGSTSVYVSEGGSATLAVNATANSAITYQWHQSGPEGWFEIENATESTYTTGAITNSTIFVCEVKDRYGNEGTISFRVSVENGLTVTAVGPTDLTVDMNGTAILQVNASATSGNLTYEWLKNEAWISGAEDATYTVDNITEYAEYTCVVRDTYSNTQYVRFYVRVNVDTGLSAVADGSTVVEVESGTRTTLKVKASTTTDADITYNWYEYNDEVGDWEWYAEAVTSFKTPVIKKDSQFKCVVRDKYGNEKVIIFTVKLAAEKGETTDPSEGTPGGSDAPSSPNPSEGNTGGNDTPSSPDEGAQTPPAGGDQQESTKPVTKLKLVGVSKKVVAGKKITLTPVFTPADATNQKLTWSSSNKKYATVSSKGVVTTKKGGAGKSVTITATTQDGSNVKATYKISIIKHAVKSIKITAKSKTVKAGKQLKLKATVKTTGKTANKTLAWTSSNTKYATVTSKGVVKTKKAGKGKKVKITAKATDGSGKKATVTIKIK